jgi:hypothetical protein
MIGRLYEKTPWKTVCAFLVALGLALAGCNSGGGDAVAAQGRIIETFTIDPNSFLLLTDSTPNIAVSDETTEYTPTSNGTVSFTLTTGAGRSFNLDPNEIVIERPGAGVVTVIRFR